ncbi:Hypothetical protein LSJ_4060c (plasmid) [Ligilactobacillus salivarius]|uniref:Uncharacterized protein n=1 Tax=Ligilactobacillus salivarius TaxID=1624 RepID=A0A089RZN6_9LACO|nr:Hypothetical protein LSJ_4060c [Ligilactobacillus salivarius]
MLLRVLLLDVRPFLPTMPVPVLVLGDVLTGEVGPLLIFALGDVRGVVRVFIRGDVLPGLTLGVDLTVTCGVVVRAVLVA